jgi:hypothetical protein
MKNSIAAPSKIIATILLSTFLLLCRQGLADEGFRCVHCGQLVDTGYNVSGKFYCKAHLSEALPKCHTCGKAIQGNYVAVSHDRRPVCLTCRESLARCFLCAMPSDPTNGGTTLSDGRSLCAQHARTGVTEDSKAQTIFQQSSGEVRYALGERLALQQPLKAVKLVGLAELQRVSHGSTHAGGLSAGRVLGITTIVFVTQGDQRWLDPAVIHLLDHVSPERMLTVAAHEYAHVWQAENHQNYAATKPVLREGFAEWVAYKVCEKYGRQDQLRIMKNPSGGIYYTGLTKFLELERNNGINGVLEFAKSSTTI